jgi:hypothetical protein
LVADGSNVRPSGNDFLGDQFVGQVTAICESKPCQGISNANPMTRIVSRVEPLAV